MHAVLDVELGAAEAGRTGRARRCRRAFGTASRDRAGPVVSMSSLLRSGRRESDGGRRRSSRPRRAWIAPDVRGDRIVSPYKLWRRATRGGHGQPAEAEAERQRRVQARQGDRGAAGRVRRPAGGAAIHRRRASSHGTTSPCNRSTRTPAPRPGSRPPALLSFGEATPPPPRATRAVRRRAGSNAHRFVAEAGAEAVGRRPASKRRPAHGLRASVDEVAQRRRREGEADADAASGRASSCPRGARSSGRTRAAARGRERAAHRRAYVELFVGVRARATGGSAHQRSDRRGGHGRGLELWMNVALPRGDDDGGGRREIVASRTCARARAR